MFSKKSLFILTVLISLNADDFARSQDAKTASGLQLATGSLTTLLGIADISTYCSGPQAAGLNCAGGILATAVGLFQAGIAIDNLLSQNDDGGAPPNPDICVLAPGTCPSDDDSPNPLDPDGDFCEKNPQICQCSGTAASSSPICNPNTVNSQIPTIKKGLTDGTIALPPGSSLEDTLAALDALPDNLAVASSVLTGSKPNSELAKLSGIRGSGGGKTARGKSGQAGLDAFNESSGFDASAGGGFGLGTGGRPASPVDTKGLGGIVFDGSLNVIDSDTGNSLSLWERATRRYQGESLFKGRAVMMARVENIKKLARVAAQEKRDGKKAAKASKVSLAPKKAADKPKSRTPSQALPVQ
jgi:hypothetical protein